MAEHPNCQAVETFLNAIPSISRPILKTQNIDGKPAHEAYTASWFDQASQIGFTVIASGEDGKFFVVTEGAHGRKTYEGNLAQAGQFGKRINGLMFGKR